MSANFKELSLIEKLMSEYYNHFSLIVKEMKKYCNGLFFTQGKVNE
jgi:hypothetical protein